MRKKTLSIFVFVFIVLSAPNISAQKAEQIKMEEEIKVSNKYYYGQGVSKDKNEAKANAKNELINEVSKLINGNSDITNESDVSVKSIKYYEIIREDKKYKVIAYVNKEDVKNTPTNRELHVVEIKTEDASTRLPVAVAMKTNDAINEAKKTERENDTRKYELKKTYINNEIIDKVNDMEDMKDVLNYLDIKKNQGKLVYSLEKDSFNDNLKNCYILICNSETKQKVALIDTLKNGSRLNLTNTEKIVNLDLEFKNIVQVYIYIY
jgi:hypothetical protein